MQSAETAVAPPGSLRELLRVAWPLVLSSGSLSLLHVVDRTFLAWHSLDEVAASLPAGLLYWTLLSVFIGTATYVNTFVAQYEGSGRPERVAAAVWQGVYLAIGAGLVLMALAPFADVICRVVQQPPEIHALQAEYLGICLLGAVPMLLCATLGCFFSGRGQNLVVMLVNMGMVAVNAGLDYLLIFGIGPFPELGIRGAGIATIIAEICAAVAYIVLLTSLKSSRQYAFWKRWRFDRELFGRLMHYGLPTGFQYLVDIAGFSLFILLIGTADKHALTATNLTFNLNSLAFTPMLGLGTAVLTLVGRRIGEGRPDLAVRTTYMAFAATAVYMGLFILLYLFGPHLLLSIYELNNNDPAFSQVAALVVQLLRFVALYAFFDGMCIVFGAALRGAGDSRFCSVMSFVLGWSLMVLPSWISHKFYGGNLIVSWSACTTYIAVLGLVYLARFRAGRWKTMRVIEDAPVSTLADPPLVGDVPAMPTDAVTVTASTEAP